MQKNKRKNTYFISLNTNIAKDTVAVDFNFSNSSEVTYSGALSLIAALKDFSKEGLTTDIHVKPTEVILNDTVWNINSGKIELQPKSLKINNFILNN